MDFTGIGKIGAFAKQKNLIFAANYRIKTGQRLTDSNGNLNLSSASIYFSQTKTSSTNSTSAVDKAKMAAIKQKLKSGKKLSQAEMNYLKEKDPKTYKKAKYADDAREELKSELKTAKTKQEAREAVMRATAKIAADCSADFESLKASAGGGGFSLGADMNFGGDFSANMNFGGDIAVEGGEISTGEISNVETSENLDATTSENVENSTTENSKVQNENSFAQGTNSTTENEDSDSAADIMDKYIYAIRAIQDEWINFINSDKYKKMPEDIFEAVEIQSHGGKKINKISNMQAVDAILAYTKSMNYRLEL